MVHEAKKNSKPPPEKDQTAKRDCISKISPHCKRKFKSHGPGNRICSACRETLKNRGDW